jgi:hypothetical protein
MQDRSQIQTTPPFPGTDLVSQINGALSTIATDFAGDNDPGAMAGAYMTWADTANGFLKRRNAANTAWVIIANLLQKSAPIYAANAIPTTDQGPIVVQSLGPMEWDGTRYALSYSRMRVQIATSNGSLVVPAGTTLLFAQGCGAGGGGGGGAGYLSAVTQLHGGGGGAGQSAFWTAVPVTPGETLTYQIGAGGSSGAGNAPANAGLPGGNGGPTRLLRGASVLLSLDFGRGGGGGTSGGPAPGGTGYPAGGWGQGCVNLTGSNGLYISSGAGANSPFGGGGSAQAALSGGQNGIAGLGFGAGGSGGTCPLGTGGTGGNGGVGAPGLLMFAW